jgi:Ca2+-binding EF-hand superfamily protein
VPNLERIVELVDTKDDGTIEFDELAQGVTPVSANRMRREPMYNLTIEQRKFYQQAWMESLAYLFGVLNSCDRELDAKREQLRIEGDRIFSDMDAYNQGYVSLQQFERWVADNCAFQVGGDNLLALQRALDRNSDYRITRDEFVASVSPAVDEEEYDDEEGKA